jgi:protein-disulfide isomerase
MGTQAGNLKPLDRKVLVRTARLLGSDCAAARALADADAHEGEVRFFLYRDQILVEKHGADPTLHN